MLFIYTYCLLLLSLYEAGYVYFLFCGSLYLFKFSNHFAEEEKAVYFTLIKVPVKCCY